MTTLRPDGLVWSTSTRTMVWIERSSPWEANTPEWHVKKAEKYNQLKCDIEAKGWKVYDLYVEIGARGHVHRPYYSLCSVLGFTKAESRELTQAVEQVAKLCRHTIFMVRYQRVWQERPLLDLFEKLNAHPVTKQTNESSLVRRERSLPRGYIKCPKKHKREERGAAWR